MSVYVKIDTHITCNLSCHDLSIMNTMMTRLHRFCKAKQLHTIISQETIKPSSPTLPRLKTRNLSSLDHFFPHLPIPWVFFYQNYNNNKGDINTLQKSLSQCLTHYYPFAGRFLTPSSSHIDCNDEGVEFLEASHDNRLDDLILKKEQDETITQLFPNALRKATTSLVDVQLNHFTCGGVALAMSISHKVADAFTMVNFFNHWANVTHGGCGSLVNPTFISSSFRNTKALELPVPTTGEVKYVIKRFVFPNSKLNVLKNKINAMSTTLLNPTRVESLTSLLFKCAVRAATTKSGSLQPSNLRQMVNLRNKLNSRYPKLLGGNFSLMVTTTLADSCQIKTITNLRKLMMEVQGITNVEQIDAMVANNLLTLGDDKIRNYTFSSVCRFPFYQVDFGWGKPIQVMMHDVCEEDNIFVLMDSPSGDGIEVTVHLEEQEMTIFEKDKELLQYVQGL